MAFLGKLAFWRRKEPDLGLGKEPLGMGGELGLGTGPETLGLPEYGTGAPPIPTQPAMPQQAMPAQPMQPFQQPAAPYGFQQQPAFQQPPREYEVSKDIEIISYKLDALRAALESINQRLANIERIAQGEEVHSRRRSW